MSRPNWSAPEDLDPESMARNVIENAQYSSGRTLTDAADMDLSSSVIRGSIVFSNSGGGLPPAGGVGARVASGDNGPMETRVAALETFAKDAGERLVRIETVLSHVEKEVGQFKWWVVGQIVALFLAVIGTGIAIQQMTVASFQGAAQVAKDAAPATAAAPQPLPPIIINVPGPSLAPQPAHKR